MFVSSPYDRSVLPVGELVAVARTVEDEGSSPLALRVARPWSAGTARFLRSSANHVFVCDTGVLRFRPDDLESVRRVAETTSRLAAAGVSVAAPLRSADGELAVSTRGYAAAMFTAVPGRQVGKGSLTPDRARAWGTGLARFHDAASDLAAPAWLDVVADAARAMDGHALLAELSGLPSSEELVGVDSMVRNGLMFAPRSQAGLLL